MALALEDRLAQARTRLLLDHPFLGALVLRLPLVAVESPWCRTVGTDARNFFYNPAYVAGLSVNQLQFVFAHEALHCALSHFSRRGHRERRRWDLACDFAINPVLIEEGLQPPPEVSVLLEYKGMTAEEIYPLLEQDPQQQSQDQHLYDGQQQSDTQQSRPQDQRDDKGQQRPGQAPPRPLSTAEQEQLAMQWRQRVAGAAQQAVQAGKLQGELARVVNAYLHPVVPWRMLLAKYMSLTGREDYSYERPSRREGSAILPSRRSLEARITVVVDTSGSITDGEVSEFLSEVNALKGQIRAYVTLLACDKGLAPDCPWEFAPWDEIRLPREITGGGGTSFLPPFQWLQQQGRHTDLLLYFTDGKGEFPSEEPLFPVIWLVKGKAEVPWGQRLQLN